MSLPETMSAGGFQKFLHKTQKSHFEVKKMFVSLAENFKLMYHWHMLACAASALYCHMGDARTCDTGSLYEDTLKGLIQRPLYTTVRVVA